MSLKRLTAYFACDECGRAFAVGLDPASTPPPLWSLFDCAVDGVRGAVDYADGRSDVLGCSSVQNDKHLCAECTEKADAAAPADEPECHAEGTKP